MNILILDDEPSARATIKAYLNRTGLGKIHTFEAGTIETGMKVIHSESIDLALLDINLREGTSFDLLSQFDKITFKIIFISAYDEYAIKAFKFNAIDYVLKPINPLEFNEAIKKAVESEKPTPVDQVSNLQESIQSNRFNKLVLKDNQAIHFIAIEDIISCNSESNYTVFHLTNDTSITISKTLGEYTELLKGKNFFRPHRSHLINLSHIKKYDKREGGSILMTNDENIPLARNKKDDFMRLISKIE